MTTANRFKFRAWLIKVKMMVKPESLSLSHSGIWEIMHRRGEVLFASDVPEKAIVMQSTGRISNKEIFDLDIVQIENAKAIVRWDDKASLYYFDPLDEEQWCCDWQFEDDAERADVIGNIYEHSHLLP